jgi:transcriptional regulator with XRE-family HTH domain
MAATLAVRKPRTWAEYVRGPGVTRKEIAAVVGVSTSIVSRWLSGEIRPSAENVVAFARAFGLRPVEALMAADYLAPGEVEGAFEVMFSPTALSDRDLLAELAQRLATRDVDDVTSRLTVPAPDDLLEGGEDEGGLG